jgi:hypothetical protein
MPGGAREQCGRCIAGKQDHALQRQPIFYGLIIFKYRSTQISKIKNIKNTKRKSAQNERSRFTPTCAEPHFRFRTIKPAENQLVAV